MFRLIAASLLIIASAAAAQTPIEFPVGAGTIGGIAAGPDGNVWFTETTANRIGRITPAGIITEFPIPTSGAHPQRITAGADHNLWFTEDAAIARISVDGAVTEFRLPFPGSTAKPVSIASGPDGNVWYTLSISRVGRVTPDGAFKEFATGYDGLWGITAGPDGNIWSTTNAGFESKICRITPDGVITNFYFPFGDEPDPREIIAGPDGNVWFTQPSAIGRVTPDGRITAYAISGLVSAITVWNGDLWLADRKRLLRVTSDGVVRTAVALAIGDVITAMTIGPDGDLWFVDASGTIGHFARSPRRRAVGH